MIIGDSMVFKYTFSHYLDIATSPSSVQILKIKAGGEYVHQRCKHLFGVYKYFKLGAIKVKLVPASTLPVSPGGLAYDNDDPQIVDPRDQMNPGLIRITNGEPIYDSLTGVDQETQRQMFLNTMLDPRWSKFMLQQGFKRTAIPLAYEVGNLYQTAYPDAFRNVPRIDKSGTYPSHSGSEMLIDGVDNANNNAIQFKVAGSNPRGLFQLGHHKKIGWLSVDGFDMFPKDSGNNFKEPYINPIPTIDCITVILPMAYKTMFYYRLFISETVYFDGIKNVGNTELIQNRDVEFRSFDNFTLVQVPTPSKPDTAFPMNKMVPYANDGHGGGI